ncbi:MAG TPA: hypothetical protein VJT54_02175 [Verrucomicrobiae bacterium]|nr:hypothetical protein [Verrucomicrobiae bacterium]
MSPLIRNRGEATDQIGRHKLLSLVGRSWIIFASRWRRRRRRNLRALRCAKIPPATSAANSERRQFDLFREELQVLSRKWSAEALDQSLEKLKPRQEALQE